MDPFGTDGLRAGTLAAWAASPTRLREDTNAEQDLALGGYRDRAVVELAQNAADAALRGGVAGRLRLTLADGVLTASNTGAPLDLDGVRGLASLRASAKQDGATSGRFGVGFAAVLTLTDRPALRSTGGGVRFDAAASRAAAGADAPVLRLPWPEPAPPEPGFVTTVVLPLRDAAAEATARALLAGLDPTLLLLLPGLDALEVVLDGHSRELARSGERAADGVPYDVTVTDTGGEDTAWRVLGCSGPVPAALLADRPAEERGTRTWRATWAVAVDPDGAALPLPPGVAAVLRAPTPSVEPLTLPLLLAASVPLAPDRRHVAPGALAEHVLAGAAAAAPTLVASLAATPALLALVPVGFAAGWVDGAVRGPLLDALVATALLPVGADGTRLPTHRTTVLEVAADGLVSLLTDLLPGLLPAAFSARSCAPALRALGADRLDVAGLVELLSGVARPASWWGRVYAALAADPGLRDADALGALPVPLADGRTVTGARGLMLAEGALAADRLADLDLRLVHPDAAHPLLLRLGARECTAATLLEDARVLEAVAGSLDAEDPEPVLEAVLHLVTVEGTRPGARPALAELALPDDDGGWRAAGELRLPGGVLDPLVADDSPLGRVDPGLLAEHGRDALLAVGVLDGPALLVVEGLVLDPDEVDLGVDGDAEWVEAVLERLEVTALPPVLPTVTLVRDLDLIAADAWGAALEVLLAPPYLPLLDDLAVGDRRLPSYLRWWLSREPVLDGLRPRETAAPGAEPVVAALYPAAPVLPGGPDLPARLGARLTVAEVLADPDDALDLLDRLADPARTLPDDALAGLHDALALALPGVDGEVEGVRVRDRCGAQTVVHPADAVLLDAPDLAPLLGGLLPVPAAASSVEGLAVLLGVAVASALVPALAPDGTHEVPVPPPVTRLLGPACPPVLHVGASLVVPDGEDDDVEVPWRVVDGIPYANGDPGAQGRALAWAAGRWELRDAVAAVLADPGALGAVLREVEL